MSGVKMNGDSFSAQLLNWINGWLWSFWLLAVLYIRGLIISHVFAASRIHAASAALWYVFKSSRCMLALLQPFLFSVQLFQINQLYDRSSKLHQFPWGSPGALQACHGYFKWGVNKNNFLGRLLFHVYIYALAQIIFPVVTSSFLYIFFDSY